MIPQHRPKKDDPFMLSRIPESSKNGSADAKGPKGRNLESAYFCDGPGITSDFTKNGLWRLRKADCRVGSGLDIPFCLCVRPSCPRKLSKISPIRFDLVEVYDLDFEALRNRIRINFGNAAENHYEDGFRVGHRSLVARPLHPPF